MGGGVRNGSRNVAQSRTKHNTITMMARSLVKIVFFFFFFQLINKTCSATYLVSLFFLGAGGEFPGYPTIARGLSQLELEDQRVL